MFNFVLPHSSSGQLPRRLLPLARRRGRGPADRLSAVRSGATVLAGTMVGHGTGVGGRGKRGRGGAGAGRRVGARNQHRARGWFIESAGLRRRVTRGVGAPRGRVACWRGGWARDGTWGMSVASCEGEGGKRGRAVGTRWSRGGGSDRRRRIGTVVLSETPKLLREELPGPHRTRKTRAARVGPRTLVSTRKTRKGRLSV